MNEQRNWTKREKEKRPWLAWKIPWDEVKGGEMGKQALRKQERATPEDLKGSSLGTKGCQNSSRLVHNTADNGPWVRREEWRDKCDKFLSGLKNHKQTNVNKYSSSLALFFSLFLFFLITGKRSHIKQLLPLVCFFWFQERNDISTSSPLLLLWIQDRIVVSNSLPSFPIYVLQERQPISNSSSSMFLWITGDKSHEIRQTGKSSGSNKLTHYSI